MIKDKQKIEHFHAYVLAALTEKLREEAKANHRKISAQLSLILQERYESKAE